MAIVDAKLPLTSAEGLSRMMERVKELTAAVCCKVGGAAVVWGGTRVARGCLPVGVLGGWFSD